MKTTSAVLLSCLLFTISANSFLCQQIVLDTNGEAVQPGVNYYILPEHGGKGGGLGLANGANSSCPDDVVQVPDENSNGLPLTFSPVNPNDSVVRISTDQNIKFSAATICAPSTVWMLDADSNIPGQFFVKIGGVEGNPGRETLNNWFRIQGFEDAYKLDFCPSVCDICRPVCGDIGTILDNGRNRLGLSDQPLKVTFKKA